MRPPTEDATTLAVLNIPAELNRADALTAHFSGFGSVVHVVPKPDLHCAFVQMAAHEEAQAALVSTVPVMGDAGIRVGWSHKQFGPPPPPEHVRCVVLLLFLHLLFVLIAMCVLVAWCQAKFAPTSHSPATTSATATGTAAHTALRASVPSQRRRRSNSSTRGRHAACKTHTHSQSGCGAAVSDSTAPEDG